MPTLKKPQTQKSNAKQEQEEKPKSLSLSSLFENADEAGGGAVKIGRYEALVTGTSQLDTEKGFQVSFELTIVNDENMTGRKTFLNYGILKPDPDSDEEGAMIPSGGIAFLKRDMKFFGEDNFVPDSKKDIIKAMEAVAEQEFWINIEVKKGKGGYINTYLQDVMEDQDEKPDRPAGY